MGPPKPHVPKPRKYCKRLRNGTRLSRPGGGSLIGERFWHSGATPRSLPRVLALKLGDESPPGWVTLTLMEPRWEEVDGRHQQLVDPETSWVLGYVRVHTLLDNPRETGLPHEWEEFLAQGADYRPLGALFVAFSPDHAFAGPVLDGTALRWPWALPFLGILLTIATGPLLFPRLWHHHYGKLAFVWGS